MPVSLDQFVRSVSESGLIPAAEMRTFLDGLPPTRRPSDGDTLAQLLVQSGKLTRYQAAATLQGKAKNLILEQYVILDKIGQGGMGVVLKARHRRMDRVVAMKMLPPAAMKSPQAVERFYQEVKAAAKLSHPNIVAAYDANEHAGVHYLVMEYVDGKDLAAIIKEHGPLPVRQAVECILQAARGLQYAHEQGIVHRDIKPANLLLDKKGTVKILDMGLARIEQAAMEQSGGDRLTQSGQIMGTGDYMAPEQALNTHEADARSDIYSLGCTLCRLLTGKPPYHGETFTELFVAHREAPIPSLSAVRPDVPAELDAIFQKMIAKYAHERQQSMAEVIDDLERFLGMRQAAGVEEEPLSDGALAFLREITQGATGTRQKVHAKIEDTFAPHGHPETGTNIRIGLNRSLRQRKGPAIALVTGLVALLGLTAFGIVITIRGRDGRKTAISVPEESQVAISKEGQIGVTLPAQFEAPKGGFDPNQAGQYKGPGQAEGEDPPRSPFVDAPGNWKLPPGAPPPAVAPFDAKKAKEHQEAWAKHLAIPVEETNSIGMKLALIPPGEFDMGSTPEEQAWAMEAGHDVKDEEAYATRVSREGPHHRVKITKPFYLGMYPVTQGEYEKVMGVNPSAFCANPMDVSAFAPPLDQKRREEREKDAAKVAGRDTSRHPVETISWNDATEFCRRLSAMPAERAARRVYRLPTEAEREYACRAGTTTQWYHGDDEAGVVEVAWFNTNSGRMTHPVGEKKPNGWGLYDMHGNVHQWCADWFSADYYNQSSPDNPIGPPAGSSRVLRGGSWSYDPSSCRSAYRSCYAPAYRNHGYGFRVVVEIAVNSESGRQETKPAADKSDAGSAPAVPRSPLRASPSRPALRASLSQATWPPRPEPRF